MSAQAKSSLSHPSRERTPKNSWSHLAPTQVRDAHERIASALGTKLAALSINHHRYSPSGWMLQCFGAAQGKRFFAKIFLVNPYPFPDRFRAPWEQPFASNSPSRPVEDQIAAEWEMTLRMRNAVGDDFVPAPLGKSSAGRVIVWEEARGATLRNIATKLWRLGGATQDGAAALCEAGKWLRKLHDKSTCGTEPIDVSAAVDEIGRESRARNGSSRKYLVKAQEVLQIAIETVGHSCLSAPLALTHGDFCLSNLIWDPRRERLAVVDFELSRVRPVYFDLFSLVSDLRVQLLNPLISQVAVCEWERAFWRGYGPVSDETVVFVNAFALARIFYQQLPKLLTRRERLGWLAGTNVSLYRALFERHAIAKRLRVPLSSSASANAETAVSVSPQREPKKDVPIPVRKCLHHDRATVRGSRVWRQCRSCGIWLRDPAPSSEDLDAYYASMRSSAPPPGHDTLHATDATLAAQYLQLLERSIPLSGWLGLRVLEFGAGEGDLAVTMAKRGANVTAVDPYGIGICRDKGLTAFRYLDELPPTSRFEGVVMTEVVEHLREPVDTLRRLHAILEAGGWLFLTTPNSGSLGARTLRGRWCQSAKLGHLYLFSASALVATISDAGFERIVRLRGPVRFSHNSIHTAFQRLLQVFAIDGGLRYIAYRKSTAS